MNCEILAVGTELLLGEIANTDAQMISKQLSELGINVYFHTVCGDNPDRLKSALAIAKSRADIIITTGGLGPTADDLTKETIAEAFGKKLLMNAEQLVRLKARMGAKMTPNNEKQAVLPENSTVLINDWGTAPGCAFCSDGCHVIMLPGPPRECYPMFTYRARPYIEKLCDGAISSSFIKIFGIGESAMEHKLTPYFETLSGVTAAPYAKEGECEVRVTAKAGTIAQAAAKCLPVVADIKKLLGDVVYGVDVSSLEEVVVRGLTEKHLSLALAESCTGGLVAKRLTDISGASGCFGFGCVTYSNEAKIKLLGVPPDVLEKYQAVSEETALAMARGVRNISGADIGVGITGVAGPKGGTEETPLGTVFIAISHKNGEKCVLSSRKIADDRARCRNYAATTALDLIRREILL